VKHTHRCPRAALAALALSGALVVGGAGCYETTPHRVEVAARVAPTDCADTIAGVFAGAGFVQLPAPPRTSMFFGPRISGAYSSLLRSRSGVGVNVTNAAGAEGECHVTIEALSPDAGCPGSEMRGGGPPLLCSVVRAPYGGTLTPTGDPACGVSAPPAFCELTSAPSPDNDAAVDELARRLRLALGPKSRVN
jgi:hypothetical protein